MRHKSLRGLTLFATAIVLTGTVSYVTSGTVSYAASGATGTAATGAVAFSDLSKTNWAYPAVSDMAAKDIIVGFPDGTFRPDNKVTYGEFIKMATVTATGKDPGRATDSAAEKKHWAQNYYDLAVEKGYLNSGKIPNTALDQPIPRRDMALIISGILPNQDQDQKVENFSKLEASLSDIDAKTPNEYDIIRVYASGVLSGYPDGTFKPGETLSRAEAASVIQRLAEPELRVLPLGGQKKTTEPAITTPGTISPAGTTTGSAVTNSAVTTSPSATMTPSPADMKWGLSDDGKIYNLGDNNVPVIKSGSIKDMISNPEKLNGLYKNDQDFTPKTRYAITPSAAPFDFSIRHGFYNKKLLSAEGKEISDVVLIKDGKIILMPSTVPVVDKPLYTNFDFVERDTDTSKSTSIPDFDYIGTYHNYDKTDTVLLIPNPWKK